MRKYILIVCGIVLVGVASFFVIRGFLPSTADQSDGHLLKIDTPDVGYLNFPVRIISKSTSEVFTFDPTKGEQAAISYKLTRDGDIRIRIVRRGQKDLVIRTLLDWTHQEFGKHEIKWDGRDASGNIVDNKRVFVDFAGDSKEHKPHEREKCHEPNLKITYPDSSGTVIHSLSEISAKVTDEDVYWGEEGYTLRVYVDYVLLYKSDTMKVSEFHLQDLPFDDGEHIITINLDDGHDHVGTASIRINLE